MKIKSRALNEQFFLVNIVYLFFLLAIHLKMIKSDLIKNIKVIINMII